MSLLWCGGLIKECKVQILKPSDRLKHFRCAESKSTSSECNPGRPGTLRSIMIFQAIAGRSDLSTKGGLVRDVISCC